MFACVCLLVCLLVVSGTELTFQYKPLLSYRRSNEPCKICYGDECLQIDQARCEYYVEADWVLREEEQNTEDNPVIRTEVDRMMYNYMEHASTIQAECIPLVSQYTNCTKENICVGCKTCNCDADGRWNCSVVNKCRSEVPSDIDHRMLLMVMENLSSGYKYNRIKRQVQDESKMNTKSDKVTYGELLRWMYGVEPIITAAPNTNSTNYTDYERRATPTISETTTRETSRDSRDINVDYLAFDEVLNNIAVVNQNYTRRKPLIHNDSIVFDYMLFDDVQENATDKAQTEDMENFVPNNTGVGETEVVIDLLESAKKNQGETFTANWTDYTDPDSKINIDPALEYIDNFIFGSKNIMKRDLVHSENGTDQANTINNVKELRNNVLLPLSNIINDKQKELEELLRVSENLINIMRSYKNQTTETVIENKNNENKNTSVSIYNFEVTPDIETISRRSDEKVLDKYFKKLKRDVYEVIRDITAIHKIKGTANVPQDLKILIRAMRHYVRNQAKLEGKNNKSDVKEVKSRRQYVKTDHKYKRGELINELIDILKFIDKNMPESNALAPLSATAKNIIKRVINNNYIDEFSAIGLRAFDPKYNLTNDLRNIGSDWPRMTNNVAQSAICDRLHSMKLLHLILSVDIIKMTNAMALLDFAYSRRMVLVESGIGGEIIAKINKGLQAINEKIKVIIKFHQKNSKVIKKNNEANKKVEKESFLRKLKNIFKTSKRDITNLLKRKVPKKDIVKELAKKKISELTRRRFQEFEETMKKWQNKLNLVPREKRFAGDVNYKNRMKNILPKYLRGKVNPAIDANKSKKSNKKRVQQKSTTSKAKSNATNTKSKLNGLT